VQPASNFLVENYTLNHLKVVITGGSSSAPPSRPSSARSSPASNMSGGRIKTENYVAILMASYDKLRMVNLGYNSYTYVTCLCTKKK
jgi:hypothetical protein